jgi:hypothetical protein
VAPTEQGQTAAAGAVAAGGGGGGVESVVSVLEAGGGPAAMDWEGTQPEGRVYDSRVLQEGCSGFSELAG